MQSIPVEQELPVIVELAYPPIQIVPDIDIAVPINVDATDAAKLSLLFSLAAPQGHKLASAVKFLNAVIVTVRDEYVTLPIHRNLGRAVKLCVALSVAAPLSQELAPCVKLLNAVMIGSIGDIDIPLAIYCYALGSVKLSLAIAKAAPLGQELAIGVDLDDPQIVRVSDIQVVLGVNGNRKGEV